MAQDSRPCKGCGETIYRTIAVAPIKHYCSPDCRPRCSVPDCGKSVHTKGWCAAHAARAARTGDPLTPQQRQTNVGPCKVDGCEQAMRKRGWCASHYDQWRRFGEIRPWHHRWAPQGGDCVVCGQEVPRGVGRRKHCSNACQVLDSSYDGERPMVALCKFCYQEFSLQKRTPNGRIQRIDTIWCPDCGRDSPDVQRFKRYGVTREQYQAATLAGCAICRRTDRPLHVDHDHSCCPGNKKSCGDCVRGFICGPCNRGLGLFFDDVAALRRAADYLDSSP